MQTMNKPVVIAWAAIAVFANILMLNVATANASFENSGTPARDYMSPASLGGSKFDNDLTIIADNLAWSVSVAADSAKQPVMAFLGIGDSYAFGQARYTSLASQASISPTLSVASAQPQVLGAFTSSSSNGSQ